ncbi:L-dopachrome tautomerase-related protein [Mucilaginibacter lacusdianchii]|uniref:L-dopachrome tautomerase-related protein n=1 Tax=Mucilaginibacter lacusdianchii TaxID=2684211 RepID=UPI00131C1EC8|nr:L-dopachrome tautomerase-related protein [Mucilaginibacter sp. JXJ CY 39]
MKKIFIHLITLVSFAGAATIPKSSTAQQPKLQQVFADNTYQFTGVAVSAKNRLFVTYPLWSKTYKYAVVEVMPNGTSKPFPDAAMNSWKAGEDGMNKWVCVQTAYVDDNDYLYIVDPAAPMLNKVVGNSAKVIKFNLNTNKIERVYRFPGTIDQSSYLNDIRVDTKKQVAYLTNSGTGGIIILDLNSGKSRQVLQNHKSVHSDPNFKFVIDGKELKKQGQPVKFSSDGIALTPDGSWLYYKPLTDKKLYRVPTTALLDQKLTPQQLSGKVQDLGNVAVTDGMIFDKKGNLIMGDMINYRMLRMSPDLKASLWFKDMSLIWPDTYSISKDGYLYITTSQINKQPDYNNGVNKRTEPYRVYKVKLP